jgi:radical SAM protein with 4Fe4S-binding SPASM domain
MSGTGGTLGTATRGQSSWQRPPELATRSERTLPVDPQAPLGRISLELSRTCNLRCTYCYSGATSEPRPGLDDDEIRAVIDEAVAAGARLISIVGGGESLLRRSLLVDRASCIDYANERGCYCCVYTNGTLVDERAARWLHQRDVHVVGKLNSLREPVQDELAGVPGAALRIRRGIDALLAAGFGDAGPRRLALETVICRSNYDELPTLWRWMRQRGIVPEVEIPTMHGRAAQNRSELYFDEAEASAKYRELFEELLAIDRAEFGYDWTPHPPFAAGSCRLYYSNCYVNDRGGVQPCAGVDREYGVLRVGLRREHGRPLVDIVSSEEFRRFRSIHDHVRGACGACELRRECYGCRAAALHRSGDLFAEDPVCWRWRAAARVGSTPGLVACQAGNGEPCTPAGASERRLAGSGLA